MSYAQDNGYTPVSFETLMDELRVAVNSAFSTSYTEETFVGTNHYKYWYQLVQKVEENEVKTAEIFAKLSEYIASTNLRIQRPSVSLPGIIDSMEANGWIASVKRNTVEDAGTISICVNVDDGAEDYEEEKLEIANFIKQFVGAGMVTLGSEETDIVLSNGQEFTFKYFLPDKHPILLRVTITSSDNIQLSMPSDEDIRQQIFSQARARYRLGWDFEPQKYYTLDDLPAAATILLEYSLNDGGDWTDEVYEANFDDLLTFGVEDIEVLIDP